MSELDPHSEDEGIQAPNSLVEALNHLYKERVFVPPAADGAMLREARKHLQRLQRPQSGWKPWLSWAAMAACLTLAIWLGERLTRPAGSKSFAREDINRDGRVDILDAFALARKIETGGTLDPRWDINGDGRIDRVDVKSIAARAVSLAQAGTAPKRSAGIPARSRDAGEENVGSEKRPVLLALRICCGLDNGDPLDRGDEPPVAAPGLRSSEAGGVSVLANPEPSFEMERARTLASTAERKRNRL